MNDDVLAGHQRSSHHACKHLAPLLWISDLLSIFAFLAMAPIEMEIFNVSIGVMGICPWTCSLVTLCAPSVFFPVPGFQFIQFAQN
jgi:hypothetical protein